MIDRLFLQVVKLCLSSSIVTVLVLLLRLCLKKAPRAIVCALWILVGLRLVIPAMPESRVSVIPEALSGGAAVNALSRQPVEETLKVREDLDPALYREIIVRYRELPVYREDGSNYVIVSDTPAHTPPKTFGDSALPVLSVIWIAGTGVMLLYMFGSYAKLRRNLRTAARKEEGVWESDDVTSPFILGIVRPCIYLPSSLNAEEAAFVLAHERTHIKRGDQIWKPLGFVLLAVYWFNPLFWLAYFLLCRDIEAACDEKVIRTQDAAYRKAYSETILALSRKERLVSACPLAFAENGVEERIRNVLSYRRPAFWLIVAALTVSLVAAGCSLTDPAKKSTEPSSPESSVPETKDSSGETQGAVSDGFGMYAAEQLEASFPFDKDGAPLYPDDYAGCYPDGKNLLLYLKDPDEESIRRYLDRIPSASPIEDRVKVEAVRYSYNKLAQMIRETAEELLADKIQVNLSSVDVKNNGMIFGVTDVFVETVRARLKEKYPDISVTVDAVGPFYFDSPDVISPVDPEADAGTYVDAAGTIRDYAGEWENERYFILQADAEEDVKYRYAVGCAPKDEKNGTVRFLAELECDHYQNLSKVIDGTVYAATDRGIFAVTPEGNVTNLTGVKEAFATYPSAGDLFLYSYMLRRDEGYAICLEAYYPHFGQTIRYLTLENSAEPENAGDNRYISAAGALDIEDGFYYVLMQGPSQEIWYQPCSVRDVEEGTVREAKPVEGTKKPIHQIFGNEHFYALVSAADSMWLHLNFLNESVAARELPVAGPWTLCPVGASPGRNGNWCFTAAKMRFEVDADAYECTIRELGVENEKAGWSLLSLSGDSREIVLQSADGHRMLFVQDDQNGADDGNR